MHRTWQRDVFMRALHRHLARETDVRWQDSGDEEKLWIQVHAAGTPAWIALPMTADVQASGMFRDIEAPKLKMLETEDRLDAAAGFRRDD